MGRSRSEIQRERNAVMTSKSKLVKQKAEHLKAFDSNTAAKKANPKLHRTNRLKLVQHFDKQIAQLSSRLQALNIELRSPSNAS